MFLSTKPEKLRKIDQVVALNAVYSLQRGIKVLLLDTLTIKNIGYAVLKFVVYSFGFMFFKIWIRVSVVRLTELKSLIKSFFFF